MRINTSHVCHRVLFKASSTARTVLQLLSPRQFTLYYSTSSRAHHISYVSTLDAEPLHRYKKGGYHPVALGDTLKDGRYKLLHKLGWGGYSTVWAARDERSVLIYFTNLAGKTDWRPERTLTLLSKYLFHKMNMNNTTAKSIL